MCTELELYIVLGKTDRGLGTSFPFVLCFKQKDGLVTKKMHQRSVPLKVCTWNTKTSKILKNMIWNWV